MTRSAATLGVFLIGASLARSADVSSDTMVASEYPAAALRVADELSSELADSLKTCNVQRAHAVYERTHDFIYKQWGWTANYEKLKPYRACFRMLINIADTTGLVTNRYSIRTPHDVAGPFDANYSACRQLADSSYELKGVVIDARWPKRFGPEPQGKVCAR